MVADYTKGTGTGPRRLNRNAFRGETSSKEETGVIYSVPSQNGDKYDGMARPEIPFKDSKQEELHEISLDMPEHPNSSSSRSSSDAGRRNSSPLEHRSESFAVNCKTN